MLLDKGARSDGIPGLDIDTNEVKATHSASVAQVDEDQVFYLRARGLPEDEAKKMIILGFFEPVISRIPVEMAREGAKFIIEGKWYGERRQADGHGGADGDNGRGAGRGQAVRATSSKGTTSTGREGRRRTSCAPSRSPSCQPDKLVTGGVEGTKVLLSNLGGEVHAVSGVCTHEDYDLSQGSS